MAKFPNGFQKEVDKLFADYEKRRSLSERSENDTLLGMDNMTEEQWRMLVDTVE